MRQFSAHLLIIDPQNDFCDLPESLCPRVAGRVASPALPVTGAHTDMLRVAELIRRAGEGLSGITVTLDSHHRLDIAHPAFWRKADGSPVAPFTQVHASDLRSGLFVPRSAAARPRVQAYLDALEATGRYVHMVWPVHCELGTWGHNVHDDLRSAYNGWEEQTLRTVEKVIKGRNSWTEHYSAIRAEVPDPLDPETQTNNSLIARLDGADRLFIAGEAGSHCVKATTEHLIEYLQPSKLVVISDGMSPVAGFEAELRTFLARMQERGARVASAAEVTTELLQNR